MKKLGIFSTHPIQYQVPVWQCLSKQDDLEVKVFYFSDQGVSEKADPGFGEVVQWDQPLLDGYDSTFLSRRPISEEYQFYIPVVDDLLEREQFDFVVLHGYRHPFALQLAWCKSCYGYKLILRGEFTEQRRRRFNWLKLPRLIYLKWFYRQVDAFCPIGKDAVRHLELFGVDPEKTHLSPYSVNNVYFENQSRELNKKHCRNSLDIPADAIVMLFSGKLIARKNPMLLADAFLELARGDPSIYIIFVGSGPLDASVRERLEPLKAQVRLPGFVNQSALGQFFKAADFFILPSQYDTWGLVINEAMHFGLPCVVSDMVGSRHDLIESGETGYVFKEGDLSSLQDALSRISSSRECCEAMGQNAHSLIQGYTVDKTAEGILNAVKAVDG